MFRLIIFSICLLVPVFCYSKGAPKDICKNNLTPNHHAEPQYSAAPYRLSGAAAVKAGEKLSLTLSGDPFLGFAIQARNEKDEPVGQFKIVESNKSQTLTCSNPDDTLTHKAIPKNKPIKEMKFEWIAPTDYKGKIKFYATVAKNAAIFWVGKVTKEVQVE